MLSSSAGQILPRAVNIFVSHASDEGDELIEHLTAAGHRVERFPPGQTFDDRIRLAIDNAKLFIFLLSPESVVPGRYTLSELGHACKKWQPPRWHILPVVLTPVPSDQIPMKLRPLTRLEPEGNLIAETLAHIAKLERKRRCRVVGTGLSAGLVAAVAFAVWYGSSRLSLEGKQVSVSRDPPAYRPGPDQTSARALTAGVVTATPAPPESTETPKKPTSRPNPLREFTSSRRCQPTPQQRKSGWYLTCVCEGDAMKTPRDVFVSAGQIGAPELIKKSIAQARYEGWHCP